MKFDKKTQKAIFISRPNRFQAWVDIDGEEIMAHVPNTGRLKEILIPGCQVLVRHEDGAKRKTAYSLIAAWKGELLINFDSQAPNKVVEEALRLKWIPQFKDYDEIEREKTFGGSRFDFRLKKEGVPDYFLEVKGVTLEIDGMVSFPDAVTARGAKHLRELVEAKKAGYGAGVILVVQLDRATHFSPNTAMDPYFTESLQFAMDHGVDVIAYTCQVSPDSLTLDQPIPIKM